MVYIHTAFFICPSVSAKNRPGFLFRKPRRFIMLYSCFFKRSRNYLRGFLMAAWAGAKIAERSDQRYYVICQFTFALQIAFTVFHLFLPSQGHKGYLQYFYGFSTTPTISAFKQLLDSNHAAIPVSRYNLLPTEC